MKVTLVLLLVLTLPLSASMADQVTVPNEFRAGTPARAQEVNENFAALAAESNAQDLRIESLEMLASGPTITDQLFCNTGLNWYTLGTARAVCKQASNPSVVITLSFVEVLEGGWILHSYGEGIWIFNELTW